MTTSAIAPRYVQIGESSDRLAWIFGSVHIKKNLGQREVHPWHQVSNYRLSKNTCKFASHLHAKFRIGCQKTPASWLRIRYRNRWERWCQQLQKVPNNLWSRLKIEIARRSLEAVADVSLSRWTVPVVHPRSCTCQPSSCKECVACVGRSGRSPCWQRAADHFIGILRLELYINHEDFVFSLPSRIGTLIWIMVKIKRARFGQINFRMPHLRTRMYCKVLRSPSQRCRN